MVLSERLCARLPHAPAGAVSTTLALKGKSEPAPVRVLDLAA